MNFLDLQNKLRHYSLFSLYDIKKYFPNFSYRQIDRWAKKGYLTKIKYGFYMFPHREQTKDSAYFAANRIYSPSYISLEKALALYNLIPDEKYKMTSVSTKKTNEFKTPFGKFNYRHIHKKLFWGYKLVKRNDFNYLLADPEKALLDYLYLNPKIGLLDPFIEKIDMESFKACMRLKKMKDYLKAFDNKSLQKRVQAILNDIKL